MSAADVVVECIDTRASGVTVHYPQLGSSPLGHLVVDVEVSAAAEIIATCTRVSAGLHGDLDIAEATASDRGRWQLEIPAVMLSSEFRLTVRAHSGTEVHELAELSGRNARFIARTGGMQALLMHQLGRAGSTMMMRLLAGHPEVAVFDEYPLETRPGLAWMHTLAVLLGAQTVRPGDEPFFDEDDAATANPYVSEYFLGTDIFGAQHRDGFDRLRGVIADTVEDMYQRKRPGASFFAEKFRIESRHAPRTQQAVLATWPESRQIILVRDPRDLLCSRLSFNRQRSVASFNLDLTDDAVTGAPTIVNHLRLAAQQYAAFPDALLVRYEDMVERPVATATRLFRELGLDHGYVAVQCAVSNAVAARSNEHVTSASVAASVGRWRAELPPEAVRHLVDELADELALLGYDQ
ncbi:MAG: sulfotransferase [Ilumatobacter sp.]|nr:sulfotransferase [Ilumatobacter sp.]